MSNSTTEKPTKKIRVEDASVDTSDNTIPANIECLFSIDSVGDISESELAVAEISCEKHASNSARPSVQVCKYFASGSCKLGTSCHFKHETRSSTVCQYFLKGNCRSGSNCRFSHQLAPCKFFQGLRGCKNTSCPFAHVKEEIVLQTAIPSGATKILDKYSSVKIAESKGVSDLQTRPLVP